MLDAITFVLWGARFARRYFSQCICVSGRCEKLRPCRGVYKHILACPIKRSGRFTTIHFRCVQKKTRVCLAEYGVDYQSVIIDLIETGKYQNISRDF